ncbi:50S ribosomal protein L21 [Moraxella catarrhalis 12P80B1]|nr:50S ribosomal protein L21 [Moraxella catarrhalis 12P80B1]
MYAVIKSGGKQHRVSVGETLKVELLKAEKGETLKIEEVLMVVDGAEIKNWLACSCWCKCRS